MARQNTELAVRSDSPRGLPTIVFKPASGENQYFIFHTLLGDAALYWTADWLAGLFCVSDFPTEWVSYVQNVVLGPRYESAWEGDERTFAVVTEAMVQEQVEIHRRVLPAMMGC
jgi:hypothetical protein